MNKNTTKKLLIVENAKEELVVEEGLSQGNGPIYLSGIFTTFGVKNRNNRVYEAKNFCRCVDQLQETIKNHQLVGQLDHPHGTDVSLTTASHVIESLEFDPQNNWIKGKIRLLNTPNGKIAQDLVNDGIPLHISSRALGQVDPSTGAVVVNNLITYDLVADPGFANARLNRVNESFGIEDTDELAIFDITDCSGSDCEELVSTEEPSLNADEPAKSLPADNKTIPDTSMSDKEKCGDFISYSDFTKYTQYLNEIIKNLQNAVSNFRSEINALKGKADENQPTQEFTPKPDNSQFEDMIKASIKEIEAEKEKENLDEIEGFSEKYEGLKKYVNYLAEKLDITMQHNDYLAESLQKVADHSDYLAENLQVVADHNDYLAESLQKVADHSDYLAESLQTVADHSDYLAENLQVVADHNDYLAESLQTVADYSEYVGKNINSVVDQINESIENEETKGSVAVTEAKAQNIDTNKSEKETLEEKINRIIKLTQQKIEESKQAAQAVLESKNKNAQDDKYFTLISAIPSHLKESWSKLSEDRKNQILNESNIYMITNQRMAESFWETRDLRELQSAPAQKQQVIAENNNQSSTTDNYKNAILKGVSRLNRR